MVLMRNLFADSDFFATLGQLWLPLVFQQLVFSALNFVSTLMVGQLGATAIAAFSLANQIWFLFQLFLFGVSSGAAIFVAQFWGNRDLANIRRVLGLTLASSLSGAGVFSIIALVFPEHALGIYSTDRAVIALGSEYLRIIGTGYIAVAISTSYAVTLRSTGLVRLPVAVSVFSLTLSAALNYILIFGHLGFPALGVQGSALGSTIARVIDCALMLTLIYTRGSIAAAKPRELWSYDFRFASNVLKTMMPVIMNEIVWSVGISAYQLIYGRMGTPAVAAVSIAASIEAMAFVPFIAVANSAAVMIGNRIGADEDHKAMTYAKRFIQMNLVGSLILSVAILLGANSLLSLYNIDATTFASTRNVLTVMALALGIKVSNMMLIVGILRAGGDTRTSALIDVGPLWLVGLPAATLGAFVFGLPVGWVYALTISDEACKMILALWRLFSKRWIHNLTRPQIEIHV
jgi:putative MATE family efflux protein